MRACVCVVQEQYKYCFKVLWDYTKSKKTQDEGTKRPARPTSSKSTDSRSQRGGNPSETARNSADRANSAHAGISQAVGQSFRTAVAVQSIGTGRKPTAFGGFTEIELSNSDMSSIA